jgi:hypothetical protein
MKRRFTVEVTIPNGCTVGSVREFIRIAIGAREDLAAKITMQQDSASPEPQIIPISTESGLKKHDDARKLVRKLRTRWHPVIWAGEILTLDDAKNFNKFIRKVFIEYIIDGIEVMMVGKK